MTTCTLSCEDKIHEGSLKTTNAEIINVTKEQYEKCIKKPCKYRLGNYSINDLSNMGIIKVSLKDNEKNNKTMAIRFLHSHISGADVVNIFTSLFEVPAVQLPKSNKRWGYFYLLKFTFSFLYLIYGPKAILRTLPLSGLTTFPTLLTGSFQLSKSNENSRASAIHKIVEKIREATNKPNGVLKVALTGSFEGGDKDIINNVGIIILYLPPLITIGEIEKLVKKKSWQALATNCVINSKQNPRIQIRDYLDAIISMSYFRMEKKTSDIFWTTSRTPREPIYVGALSQLSNNTIHLDISITSGRQLKIPEGMTERDYKEFAKMDKEDVFPLNSKINN